MVTMNEFLEKALKGVQLNEKGGRSKMPQPLEIWRKDIEKTDDKTLLAFYKKADIKKLGSNVMNMLMDEIKKRGLKDQMK